MSTQQDRAHNSILLATPYVLDKSNVPFPFTRTPRIPSPTWNTHQRGSNRSKHRRNSRRLPGEVRDPELADSHAWHRAGRQFDWIPRLKLPTYSDTSATFRSRSSGSSQSQDSSTVSNSESETSLTGSKTNSSGSKTNSSGSKTNSSGSKTNSSGSKTNSSGSKTNSLGSRSNLSGSKSHHIEDSSNAQPERVDADAPVVQTPDLVSADASIVVGEEVEGGTDGRSERVLEQAIRDFLTSRKPGFSRALHQPANRFDGQQSAFHSTIAPTKLATGYLMREGIVIGKLDAFGPRLQREFIVPMFDNIVEMFLNSPGVLRTSCQQTRCEVQLTRRILNRKLMANCGFIKYLIVRICGPSTRAIANCDRMMQKMVPNYRLRREYTRPATCTLFLKEMIPDNTDLYFNHQRTGVTSEKLGALKLVSPFGRARNNSENPWRQGILRSGVATLCGNQATKSSRYLFTRFAESSKSVPHYCSGISAIHRVSGIRDAAEKRARSFRAAMDDLTIPIYC